MIIALDHVAIAVTDFDQAIARFARDFGLSIIGKEEVPAAKTKTASFSVKGTQIELVHPLEGEGPIAKFLSSGKKGLHHLCFRSDNIEADRERLAQLGYRFLTDTVQSGANGSKVIFIDPKCCDGVLIELCQRPSNAVESGASNE